MGPPSPYSNAEALSPPQGPGTGGPTTRGYRPSRLPLKLDGLVEDLVRGRNDLGGGLVAPLRLDEVGEFLRQVHVARLQRPGHHGRLQVAARLPELEVARGAGRGEEVLALLLQAVRVVDVADGQLLFLLLHPVGVVELQLALRRELNAGQLPRRVAVLALEFRRGRATELRNATQVDF